MSRTLYRFRQGLHALVPRVDSQQLAAGLDCLEASQRQLFLAMPKRDQRHGLAVMRKLREAGMTEPHLLQAALLHDCGKGNVPVWLRVAYVLHPTLVASLAREDSRGWRGAAYRLVHHGRLGAELAQQAGSAPQVAAFIRGEAPEGREQHLQLLRAADDAN